MGRDAFLVGGERSLERHPDRRGQPLLVRAGRLARRGGADDTLGQGQEPRPGVLHSRTHRVPDERDADLALLWACLSPVSLEERQYLYEDRAKEEVMGLRRQAPTGIAF
jgi:hypothetical protein